MVNVVAGTEVPDTVSGSHGDVAHWRTLPCAVDGSDLWFAATPEDADRAKRLCRGCPQRRECLEGAIARGEPWGVWGGEVFYEGVVVARKRTRGRPAADELQQRERERQAREALKARRDQRRGDAVA